MEVPIMLSLHWKSKFKRITDNIARMVDYLFCSLLICIENILLFCFHQDKIACFSFTFLMLSLMISTIRYEDIFM